MAKSYSITNWLGQPIEGKYTFEQGSALIAAEPHRDEAIRRLQTVAIPIAGRVRIMSRQEATDLVDNIILGVYGAAKLGVESKIPLIEKRVKHAVLGVVIGVVALSLAGSILVTGRGK